jgi:hypothetical protein
LPPFLFLFLASLSLLPSLLISLNHRPNSKPARPSIRPSNPRQTRDQLNNTNDTPTQPRETPGSTQPSTQEPTHPSPPTYLQLPISTDPAWPFTATAHVPTRKQPVHSALRLPISCFSQKHRKEVVYSGRRRYRAASLLHIYSVWYIYLLPMFRCCDFAGREERCWCSLPSWCFW